MNGLNYFLPCPSLWRVLEFDSDIAEFTKIRPALEEEDVTSIALAVQARFRCIKPFSVSDSF